MNDHRVADGGVSENVAGLEAARLESVQGAGGGDGELGPDGFAGGGKGAVRESEAEGFADDLSGGGGAKKLAAATGGAAGATAEVGRFREGDEAVGITRAEGLHSARVFAVTRREGDAAGDEDGG